MPIVNIDPHHIFMSPPINGVLYILNTNNPAAPFTDYTILIVDVGHWDVSIGATLTHTYHPHDHAVHIQNDGPSRLQAVYGVQEMTPNEAGWTELKEMSQVR